MSNIKQTITEIDELELLREAHQTAKEKALAKRKNDIKKKRRRKAIISGKGGKHGWYNPAVGWVKTRRIDGEYVELGYVVYPKNSNRQRDLKRQSARRNRRRPIEEDDRGNKGNLHKRAVDYDWELW